MRKLLLIAGSVFLALTVGPVWSQVGGEPSTAVLPTVELYLADYIGQQGSMEAESGEPTPFFTVNPARWFWGCYYGDPDGGGPRSVMYWEVLGPYGYLDFMATTNHKMAYGPTLPGADNRYFYGYQETWKPGLYQMSCAITQDGTTTVRATMDLEVVEP